MTEGEESSPCSVKASQASSSLVGHPRFSRCGSVWPTTAFGARLTQVQILPPRRETAHKCGRDAGLETTSTGGSRGLEPFLARKAASDRYRHPPQIVDTQEVPSARAAPSQDGGSKSTLGLSFGKERGLQIHATRLDTSTTRRE